MIFSDAAKESIIKWVDTQITFNPDNICQNTTTGFFKAWQTKYCPDHPFIEIHSTLYPGECQFSWSVYLCTSSERFKQFSKTQFVPDSKFDVLWADFVLNEKEHIIIINIIANSVQNILVHFE